MQYPKSFQSLIDDFSRLPSIGPKMAERLVLYVFKQDSEYIEKFSKDLQSLTALKTCQKCFHICEEELCDICKDSRRDTSLLCIVEDVLDVISLEKTGHYKGLYHVLGGTIEPGNEKKELTLSSLFEKLGKDAHIKEVIFAFNPTAEGDLTMLYLKKRLSEFPAITLSSLGRGLSTGSDIEYADDRTLSSALSGRTKL